MGAHLHSSLFSCKFSNGFHQVTPDLFSVVKEEKPEKADQIPSTGLRTANQNAGSQSESVMVLDFV
jgi:hypothetical protein